MKITKKLISYSVLFYLFDIIDYSKSNKSNPVFRITYERKYLFFGFLLTDSVSI
jgi:hypothetical protein